MPEPDREHTPAVGADDIVLTEVPIAASSLAIRVASNRAGAIATFEGVVRDHHAGKPVSYLEYEVYGPMAKRVLREIAEEASARWDVEGIAVAHRYGRLAVGDVSVAIAVSAVHRAEAFDALRYIIDTLKERVPIWKRETGPDGVFWIEGPRHVDARD